MTFNTIKNSLFYPAIFIAIFLLSCNKKDQEKNAADINKIGYWLTKTDSSVLFRPQNDTLIFVDSIDNENPEITVNDSVTFQEMDGFGFTLTGGSAILLNQLSKEERSKLLKELFGTEGESIGISYLRISIGASDLSDRVFSYNDLGPNQTDKGLEKFSLDAEKKDLIPVMKEILAINPDIKIMGSPWSPPVWMKTNNNSKGGSLKPEYFETYANYFVKYILGMEKEGIKIDAITVQNEPLHPGNNPSLLMLAEDQAVFVKKNLGPAFEQNNIKTKIIIYDHNADRIDYPLTILNDPEAKKYVDGSAFHLYGGTIDALSEVHKAHPDRKIYFTEQWVGAPGNFKEDFSWHIKNLIIGAPRNWCSTVLEWNLAADPNQDPHTEGGCDRCLGAITIGDTITRNVAYYIVAQASKFVRPGSVRIESNLVQELPNVAFKTKEGRKVLIVFNESKAPKSWNLKYGDKVATTTLPPESAGTYIW